MIVLCRTKGHIWPYIFDKRVDDSLCHLNSYDAIGALGRHTLILFLKVKYLKIKKITLTRLSEWRNSSYWLPCPLKRNATVTNINASVIGVSKAMAPKPR